MGNRNTLLINIFLIFFICSANAAEIRIGLFYGKAVQSFVFTVVEGEYILSGDNRQLALIRKGAIFHIDITGSQLVVNDTLQSYGAYMRLDFSGVSSENVFQIKPVFPSLPSKESDDNLTIGVLDNAMQIVNILGLEKYIPGTVETEGGSNAPDEYYKAQAVIARTFAIKNFHRHAHEGFNLCDGVHCQAYNGKSWLNTKIYAAALFTKNQILVDVNGQPVITAYHANCGGITASASVVWNKDLPYLVPVNDPFCNASPHRNWIKSITIDKWNAYLDQKFALGPLTPSAITTSAGRQKYLDPVNHKLLLTDIREDLKLKSSFFTIEQKNDTLVIRGHGYGHGLGLCQEGAMEMARVGYTYVDILMFYFRGLSLARQ
jgi:stage II sporulation protein D